MRDDDQALTGKKLTVQQAPEVTVLRLKQLDQLQECLGHVPNASAAIRNEPNKPCKYNYFIQARVTLYSGRRGFVGRTYEGQRVKLDPITLLPDNEHKLMNDQALFYSKYADKDLQAVIEFVLITQEAQLAGRASARATESQAEEKKSAPGSARPANSSGPAGKSFGIGWCVVQLFELAAAPAFRADLRRGTPRVLLSGKEYDSLKFAAGKQGVCTLSYEVHRPEG